MEPPDEGGARFRAWARWSLLLFGLALLTNPALLLGLLRPVALRTVRPFPGAVTARFTRQNTLRKVSRSYWVSVGYSPRAGGPATAACTISEEGYGRIAVGDGVVVHPLALGRGVLEEDFGQSGHAAALLGGLWLVLLLTYAITWCRDYRRRSR